MRPGQISPIPTPELRRLAETTAKATDISYGGVDVIRDKRGDYSVLEVNSVSTWRGLQSACSTNIADLLVKGILYDRSSPISVVSPRMKSLDCLTLRFAKTLLFYVNCFA